MAGHGLSARQGIGRLQVSDKNRASGAAFFMLSGGSLLFLMINKQLLADAGVIITFLIALAILCFL